MGRDTFHYTSFFQALPSLALNPSRDGPVKTALGNFYSYHSLLRVIHFFIISHLTLPSISGKPFPLVLSLHTLVQRPSPALLEILEVLDPQQSCPGGTSPALSASLQSRPAPALGAPSWPPLDSTPTALYPSCAVGPELEAAVQVGSEQSRGEGDKCPGQRLCCFLLWCVSSSVPQGTSCSAQRHKDVGRACSCFALLPMSGESSEERVLSSSAGPRSVQLTCPSPP